MGCDQERRLVESGGEIGLGSLHQAKEPGRYVTIHPPYPTGVSTASDAVQRLDVAAADLPLALAELHWSVPAGQRIELHVRVRRAPRGWSPGALEHVVGGAGFSVLDLTGEAKRAVLRTRREVSLPDTVAPAMQVLFCGLNPSIYAAERGIAFARPGNRFWPALRASGLVSVDRDPLEALRSNGVGITDLVKRATVRSAELAAAEYVQGLHRVEHLVRWLKPEVVCFVGLEGWRAAVDRVATAGPVTGGLGGRPLYLMPSTSGLNAHSPLAALVEHIARARALAHGTAT